MFWSPTSIISLGKVLGTLPSTLLMWPPSLTSTWTRINGLVLLLRFQLKRLKQPSSVWAMIKPLGPMVSQLSFLKSPGRLWVRIWLRQSKAFSPLVSYWAKLTQLSLVSFLRFLTLRRRPNLGQFLVVMSCIKSLPKSWLIGLSRFSQDWWMCLKRPLCLGVQLEIMFCSPRNWYFNTIFIRGPLVVL